MFTISKIKKHCTSDSTWIIIHGHVYDCTRFLKDHPGGVDSILINADTDCTEEFDAIHSDKAKQMLQDFRIGDLMSTCRKLITTPPPPREKISCKLVSKTSISHDDQLLGLPVGKHIFLCTTINDKLCMRAYTPTSSVDEVGFSELVIKVYFKACTPSSQTEDSCLNIWTPSPLGHIEYTERGNFLVHRKQRFAKRLAMLANGTGITPIYQVAQTILKDPEDRTKMHEVYANKTEDDILLKDEMDVWEKTHCDRFKVWYVVGTAREGWGYSVGFITESITREHLPETSRDALAFFDLWTTTYDSIRSAT
ncbi:hypothetical protein JHK84_036072 [Glycine max]|nr:hypothetical protein JHK84_036072 [Glycine max]